MKPVKDKASEKRGVSYLKPGDGPLTVPGTAGTRVFVLGPPHDADLLADEDPHGGEGFPDDAHGFTFSAATTAPAGTGVAPFANRFAVTIESAFNDPDPFFIEHYGKEALGMTRPTASKSPTTLPGAASTTSGSSRPRTSRWR
jgi:hypothetical protein